jgi:hypothetical protein
MSTWGRPATADRAHSEDNPPLGKFIAELDDPGRIRREEFGTPKSRIRMVGIVLAARRPRGITME